MLEYRVVEITDGNNDKRWEVQKLAQEPGLFWSPALWVTLHRCSTKNDAKHMFRKYVVIKEEVVYPSTP